jgi:hypothetical protein
MKKTLPVIFSLTLPLVAEESAWNLASHFAHLPLSEQTMANLPKGREEEVLNTLIKEKQSEVLLRLNHGPTIDRIVGEFKQLDGKAEGWRRTMERSGSPYIIDELAPQLYETDVMKARDHGGDWGSDYGESAQAAEIIGQLIIRAPEFPPEVKEWAKQHLGMPGKDIIQAGRAWWELNRDALLANQFDQVKVPASYPKSNTVPIPPPRDPSPANLAPPPAPAASSPVAPASDPTPTAPTAPPAAPVTPPAATLANSFWWLLAALAALAVAFFAARKKKPKH